MTLPKQITKTGGKNNWYTLNITLNPRPLDSKFSVEFNHTSLENIDFQSAADLAIKDIASLYKNFYVGLSGGLDSEFLANVLQRNSIPFTPVIAIIPGSTEHYYALYWCYQNKVTPVVIDLASKQHEIRRLAATVLKTIPTRDVLYSLVGSFVIEYAKSNNGIALVADPDLTPKDTSIAEFNFNTPVGNTLDTIVCGHISELLHNNAISFFWYTPELVAGAVKELNANVNFDIARAELYGISYRPKQQQRIKDLLSKPTLTEVNRMLDHINMSEVPAIEWDRSDLLLLLNK